MKTLIRQSFIALASIVSLQRAAAQGTAFTYQGRLNDGTNLANGSYDLKFSLFDNALTGNRIGSSLIVAPAGVTNGLFTVTLDFGANFPGASRWLEIGVRTNGSVASYATLSPRQQLTPAPYAITAENIEPGAGLAGRCYRHETVS